MASPYREPAPGSTDASLPEGSPKYTGVVEWYIVGEVSYAPVAGGVLVRPHKGGVVFLRGRDLQRRLTGHVVRKDYHEGEWTDCRSPVYELRIAHGQPLDDGWEMIRPFWGAARTPDSGA